MREVKGTALDNVGFFGLIVPEMKHFPDWSDPSTNPTWVAEYKRQVFLIHRQRRH